MSSLQITAAILNPGTVDYTLELRVEDSETVCKIVNLLKTESILCKNTEHELTFTNADEQTLTFLTKNGIIDSDTQADILDKFQTSTHKYINSNITDPINKMVLESLFYKNKAEEAIEYFSELTESLLTLTQAIKNYLLSDNPPLTTKKRDLLKSSLGELLSTASDWASLMSADMLIPNSNYQIQFLMLVNKAIKITEEIEKINALFDEVKLDEQEKKIDYSFPLRQSPRLLKIKFDDNTVSAEICYTKSPDSNQIPNEGVPFEPYSIGLEHIFILQGFSTESDLPLSQIKPEKLRLIFFKRSKQIGICEVEQTPSRLDIYGKIESVWLKTWGRFDVTFT